MYIYNEFIICIYIFRMVQGKFGMQWMCMIGMSVYMYEY